MPAKYWKTRWPCGFGWVGPLGWGRWSDGFGATATCRLADTDPDLEGGAARAFGDRARIQITGVNLTFTVDGAVEPASVAGYIVGLGSFKVELWGVTADWRNIYAIRNVPEGEHDVIVVGASEGSKTVDRGIRVSDVTFYSAKPRTIDNSVSRALVA